MRVGAHDQVLVGPDWFGRLCAKIWIFYGKSKFYEMIAFSPEEKSHMVALTVAPLHGLGKEFFSVGIDLNRKPRAGAQIRFPQNLVPVPKYQKSSPGIKKC